VESTGIGLDQQSCRMSDEPDQGDQYQGHSGGYRSDHQVGRKDWSHLFNPTLHVAAYHRVPPDGHIPGLRPFWRFQAPKTTPGTARRGLRVA